MKAESAKISAKFTSHQAIIIALLAFTQFTVVLDFMVINPLGDMLMKAMSLTTKQFGYAVSGYAFSAGISGILAAGFADRFDRKKILIFFYIGFIVGTFLCAITTSYYMLLFARIFTGIFGGVIGSIALAIVADIFSPEQRGRVMGFVMMGFGASQVLGIPISLYIANAWHWQSPFLMIVVLSIIILSLIFFKLQPITKHLEVKNENNPFRHLWLTVKQRDYRIGFLTTALLSVGGFMMMPWGSVFAINNLHVTKEQLPVLFMVAGLSSLVIMPVVGRLSDKYDRFKIFTIASVWMMAVVLIYTNLTPCPFWVLLAMNIAMMIGIMSRMAPSMALTSMLPKLHDRGAFMSVNSSLQQFAGGIAAVIGGLIVVKKDDLSPIKNYDKLGYLIVVLTVICIFMVHRVTNIVKKRREAEAIK